MEEAMTRLQSVVVKAPANARRAFTLIELLLVLVILGVLAALVVPRFARRSEDSKITAAATDIANLSTALRMFEVDCSRYPTTEEGLAGLIQGGNIKGWKRPYLEKNYVPKDPWGNAYVYRCPGQHNADGFDLYSYGPDGQDGGGDDIDNWTQK